MSNYKSFACLNKLSGVIEVAGDKSISHRSIMFGALANGVTEVTGFLEGEDCIATKNAFANMGVVISYATDSNSKLLIKGVGLNGLKMSSKPIDVGNSGTAMRLLAGVLAAQKFSSTLIGDSSLMSRPMARIRDPLLDFGANISTKDNGCAPIKISPVKSLVGIDYKQKVASAQIKSALLFAGLYAKGQTTICEPGISRDHTERMLESFGYEVSSKLENSNKITSITGGKTLKATNIKVPGDISSAAFFIVATLISPKGSQLIIKNVGINPTRIGVINILKQMGADISFVNKQTFGKEPVADISVKASELSAIKVSKDLVPLAIDEFPVIFIAAACAKGKFILTDAKELRVKESDRISAMAKGLIELGVTCKVLEDGIMINGKLNQEFKSTKPIDSFDDHRIAMSFAIAGIRSRNYIEIKDCDNVVTSFPNFLEITKQIGLNIENK